MVRRRQQCGRRNSRIDNETNAEASPPRDEHAEKLSQAVYH